MLNTLAKILILSFCLISISVTANDKPTISWLSWEQPPNFITKGPFQGQGIGDSFTRALQARLTDYQHETLVANARRYNRLIREENVCVA